MKSIIVGTAGHIDHGKSALVRALTGTDPDRLEEEKRRGITIDIGFAHLELPASGSSVSGETPMLRLGFVDVPGHERFVRNMLAGAGGIDVVLLVIAADEGIKPQTREHFEIVRLLQIPRGIVVLSKSDLVDAETLDVARLEVEEYLRGSFLESAPILPVSSKTGAGLEELKRELARIASEVRAKDSQAAPRLPIDRVFSMKGFGTVVTGTLISGAIRKEQELVAFPTGRELRVRGVQVHGQPAEQAVAGERTALNLAGMETSDLSRGMTLSVPEFRASSRIDVQLSLLRDAKPLKDRARVHLHFLTTETVAEVVFLAPAEGSRGHLKPGESSYAQLRLREPWLVLPGDHFIIRQLSPVITIGGGEVIDAAPLRWKVPSAARRAELEILSSGEPEIVLKARIARRLESGLTVTDAVMETGWLPKTVEAVASHLVGERQILRLGGTLISIATFEKAKTAALNAIESFHKSNPLVPGVGRGELGENLELGAAVFDAVLDSLAKDKKIEIGGEQVRLAGRGVAMKDDEVESHRQIEHAFASAGLKVPALKDVLAGVKIDRARAQQIVTLLLREKVLVKLSDDLVFHRDALDALRKTVAAQKTSSARIDVARFKDLAGVSRKYAIPLLEWLDRERVTRRVGDERVIL